MDNERKSARLVREALEEQCAFLEPDPYLAKRVLNAAKKEAATKEKKPPRGLVFALVLVLMTMTAVAVSLRHNRKSDQTVVAATITHDDDAQERKSADTGDEISGIVARSPDSCGHAVTTVESTRRYAFINDREHKYVETFYSICKACGQVLWMRDELLAPPEGHQKGTVEPLEEIWGIYVCRYFLCELCHYPCYTEMQYASPDQILTTLSTSSHTQFPPPSNTQSPPLKPSELAGCGHADASVGWLRRYTPIGTGEHKLVDTYYAMCHRCGEVFWVQDATLLRETHDETMAAFTLDASTSDQRAYTCKYCYIQWYGEEP